ncbi:hypothetical protein BCR44DRAFT_210902 [Catenaria anguillulae PL171]|uniref:Uncharacterized protein n=1 Tax=Catenaria anguillulae PL171 TaxID=765915 RepID=A0A1Y2HZM7_9FUNG|nr:hypothetical protein BCR44DRAFT_210902 [Catenaria anguillulae PL171]
MPRTRSLPSSSKSSTPARPLTSKLPSTKFAPTTGCTAMRRSIKNGSKTLSRQRTSSVCASCGSIPRTPRCKSTCEMRRWLSRTCRGRGGEELKGMGSESAPASSGAAQEDAMDVDGKARGGGDDGDFVMIETGTAILCDGTSQDSVANLKRACDTGPMAHEAFEEAVANTEFAEDPSALVDHSYADFDLLQLEHDPDKVDDGSEAGGQADGDSSTTADGDVDGDANADACAGDVFGGDTKATDSTGGEGKGIAHVTSFSTSGTCTKSRCCSRT